MVIFSIYLNRRVFAMFAGCKWCSSFFGQYNWLVTYFKPLTPEFMKWARPSKNFDISIDINMSVSQNADWQTVQLLMR